MQAREDALRRHFAQRPCSVCHHRQMPETMLTLVRRPRAWVVMATCGACHHRGIYLISFPAPSSRTTAIPTAPAAISQRDVTEMRSFLDHFDGDFLSLFGKGHHGPGRFAAE